jgi:hypothetical protein
MAIRDCRIVDTTYPAIAVCDSSRASVEHCFMKNAHLNGVVVRSMSSATFRNCSIENVGQHGIVVSESQDVRFFRCLVANAKYAALSVYNHSTVLVSDSVFFVPAGSGIDVFTGGRLCCCRSVVAGASNSLIAVHHGGSARFAKAILHPGLLDIQHLNLRRVSPTVGWQRLCKFETSREVICLGGFVVGEGVFNVVLHEGSIPGPLGQPCSPPVCKLCGGSAKSCCFSPCGHALYCHACWDRLLVKPTLCELCMVMIEDFIVMRDCSWEGSVATCPICTDGEANVVVVPCGHTLCFGCAQIWFASNQACPYCGSAGCRSRFFVEHS